MPAITVGQYIVVTGINPSSPYGSHSLRIPDLARIEEVRSGGNVKVSQAWDYGRHVQTLCRSEYEIIPELAVGAVFIVIYGYYDSTSTAHNFIPGTRVRVIRLENLAGFVCEAEEVNCTSHTQYLTRRHIGLEGESQTQSTLTETQVSPVSVPEEPICPACGELLESTCAECGRGFCCTRQSRDDESLCVGCGRTYEPIQDSGCRDYPDKQPNPAPYPNFLYLGVELEVECQDEEREEIGEAILRKHKKHLILKEDGSLDNGFEMVTGPFALEVHQKIWGEIADTAIRAGARSWEHSTTGLHIHLSRKFFTPLVLGKVLVFLNSNETREKIVRLAGRTSPDYAAMAKKKHADIYAYRIEWDESGTERRVRRRRRECTGSGNRYEALNLQPDKTVEIRIFKGTLHEGHILANIEFAHALAYWATDCSIAESESWPSFWRYVLGHRKLYSHLIKYMAREPESER